MTKIIFFGDPDVTSDADDIYTALLKEQNVDLFVNLGDNGYHGANPVELLEKYFPKDSEQYKKLILILGNHDDGESESDSTEQKCGAFLPEQYKSKPEFDSTDQSWENTRWLTSRKVGDVYFIGMNSQDMDIEFKRNQFNWVEQQINTAKSLKEQKQIKWVINASHKPWFTLKSSHSPYTAVREIYSKLFEDLVNQNWHGHNHNDQAWYSMIAINQSGNAAGEQKQSFLEDGKTIDHSKPHGWTTNIEGHSGHEHNKFKENATANKNVMWANDKTFTYAVAESNGDILNTKWKDKSGNVLFEYNISQADGTTPTDCSDPNKCKDPSTGECRAIGFNEIKDPVTGQCKLTTPEQPIAKLSAPTSVKVNATSNLDTTGSANFDELEISQLAGTNVTLKDIGNNKIEFTAPANPDVLKFEVKAIKGTESSTAQASIQVVAISPPPCKQGEHWDEAQQKCVPDVINPPETGKLTPISIAASSADLGKEASKAADGNFDTRWSALGDGQWIEFKFDRAYPITKVKLTCYHYDKDYFFEIAGKQFKCSAGRPVNALIEYDLKDLKINSDKIRIIGHGNSVTKYNSFREIEFYSEKITDPKHCEPGYHWDESLQKCIPDLEPIIDPDPQPNPPVAKAGNDQTVKPNVQVTLDGSGSTGNSLKYEWTQISGQSVNITNANQSKSTFVSPNGNPQPSNLDAKLKELIGRVEVGQVYTIDGSQSTGNITQWSIIQESTDNTKVTLTDVPNLKYSKSFTFPNTDETLHFTLSVSDGIKTDTDKQTVSKSLSPNPDNGLDEFGMKMLFKPTGKKVAMEHGSEHENGKRYNVNHKFHNYIMQGYYKLGKGQEKINHKGDGPNHGGCTDKKICAWYELDYVLATGKGELQLENPHPTNNDVPESACEFVKTAAKAQEGQWIGWATAYFWGPDGKRHIRSYVDTKPFADIFKAEGKPLNNWEELVFAIEKGQIFKGITHPRNMQEVIDHEAGLESEVRMHRATQKDTDMKNVFVFEIEPQNKNQVNENQVNTLMDTAALAPTDLTFQLKVTDDKGLTSTDTVKVTVSEDNIPPPDKLIANAGQDQIVGSKANVTLNGTSSTAPNGTIVSYKWVQTGGPTVTLNTTTSAIVTFTAPDLFATEPPKNYKYEYSHKWGSNGTGNGQFRQLEGIAVDKDNNIYVGDWVRHDIQKFKPDGTFIRRFGGAVGQPSSANGEFNTPFSIRFDPEDGHMWVADQFNHRLQKINRDTGAYMRQIGPTISGATPTNLNEPEDVDFDPIDYSIYINDQHNSRIIKVDTTGKFITQWQPFDETYPDEYPEGISVNPVTRNLYVTAYFTPKVSVFSPAGKLLFDIKLPEGTGSGQFTLPLERNYFHKDGTFYQLNGNSKPKVYVFNTEGNLLTEFGTGPGSGDGQLDDAEQVAVDSNHNVYIIDQNNYRISVFKGVAI